MKQQRNIERRICCLLLALTWCAGGWAQSDQSDNFLEALVPGSIEVNSAEEVMAFLGNLHFEWSLGDGSTLIVPRIVTQDLPRNWERGVDMAARKSIFIRLVAPLILIANEQINADRTYILDALASGHGEELRSSERYRMIVSSYQLPADADPLKVLKRVDIIPPALAISQAILESGWGTSRFAAEGNALYGQWVWGGGMEPEQRNVALGDYGVQSHSSLLRSTLSYMLALNTNHHYLEFRTVRMEMRLLDKPLDACSLVTHLSAYAELDVKAYRKILCDLINQNNLHIADSAILTSAPAGMLDFHVAETLVTSARMPGPNLNSSVGQ